MITFNFDKYCCGCSACFNICPVNAIIMKTNREGFLMPDIDKSLCINCGMCDKACPYLNCKKDKIDLIDSKSFLYYYKDEKIRSKSASGAAFYAIALETIENNGYVCGCIWNENLEAEHIVSNKLDDVLKMLSSKYVQSKINNCYREIKEYLETKKPVLFSGTPCQVAGLRSFLAKEYDNLLTVSVICHGTPSPEVWKRYKNALEKKFKSKMTSVNMRDKSKYGYTKSVCRYEFENGKVVNWETYLRDIYCFCFTDDLYIRNSCLSCKYKGDFSKADIILGDYHKNIDGSGKYGVNIVLCATLKGEAAVKKLKNSVIINYNDKHQIKSNNMLWNSTKGNSNRKSFFDDYDNTEIVKCIKKYIPFRFWFKVILNKLGVFKVAKRIKDIKR